MRRQSVRSLTIYLGAALTALVLASVGHSDGPSRDKLGSKIDNVVFKDATGKTSALYDLKDRKAIVVVFLSFDCPVSNSYSADLAKWSKEYGEKGVAFVGVCVCDDDAATVAKQAKEYNVPFPVYRDEKFAAADALRAQATPEAFVLDGEFKLRYRGRIDNGWAARLRKNTQTTRQDLLGALDEVLSGKEVTEPATKPIGCSIVRPKATSTTTAAISYHKDVLPILQNHCQSCHRPGEVGPFSLMTYKQAANWAADIKQYTQARTMPPWKPTEGPAFRDDRRLSDQDIATLAAWVDSGTPEGNVKDAPPAKKFPTGWQLGKPDLVLTMDEDFELGPTGRDVFRCYVFPTNLDEDKYVTAVEVRPGNPRIVHHTLNFIDIGKRGRALEQKEKDREKKATETERGPGYNMQMGVGFLPSGLLGGWAPGQAVLHLPGEAAYPLAKGSDVVIQVHYHRNGRPEKDRTQIGLYFSPKPVARRYQSVVVPGRFLFMPANVEDFKVAGSIWVDQDCDLHSVMPHMHMLGKTIKVTMTPPGGEPTPLVTIGDWDYNWQETYFLKEPIAVKAGTRFDVEAHYDNSGKNPRNPNNPPRLVRFGEQTTDEMCFVFLGATSDKPGRIRVKFDGPK